MSAIMSAIESMEPVQTSKQAPELSINDIVQVTSTDDFDPQKHLDFKQPERIFTMSELELDQGDHVSSVAVSEPFQLFTEEAIERMRQEIFKPEIMANYQYSSNLAQCQLRGYAQKAAPFIYNTWKDPEVLAIVSKIAGIELVPVLDFEIAHINLSTKSEKQRQEEMATLEDRKLYEEDEGIAGCPWEDDKPIVDWHRDSYPFVCVTMLSDCTNMQGGETALRTGDGNIMKVRGPGKGCAVILQGRYIEHQALRAFGTCERITSVTSFRPKHHSFKDESVLSTVRGISDLPVLYREFFEYRLEILEERIRDKLSEVRKGGKKFNTLAAKAFMSEQEEFLAHTNKQIIPDELVLKGHIDDNISNENNKNSTKEIEQADDSNGHFDTSVREHHVEDSVPPIGEIKLEDAN